MNDVRITLPSGRVFYVDGEEFMRSEISYEMEIPPYNPLDPFIDHLIRPPGRLE